MSKYSVTVRDEAGIAPSVTVQVETELDVETVAGVVVDAYENEIRKLLYRHFVHGTGDVTPVGLYRGEDG